MTQLYITSNTSYFANEAYEEFNKNNIEIIFNKIQTLDKYINNIVGFYSSNLTFEIKNNNCILKILNNVKCVFFCVFNKNDYNNFKEIILVLLCLISDNHNNDFSNSILNNYPYILDEYNFNTNKFVNNKFSKNTEIDIKTDIDYLEQYLYYKFTDNKNIQEYIYDIHNLSKYIDNVIGYYSQYLKIEKKNKKNNITLLNENNVILFLTIDNKSFDETIQCIYNILNRLNNMTYDYNYDNVIENNYYSDYENGYCRECGNDYCKGGYWCDECGNDYCKGGYWCDDNKQQREDDRDDAFRRQSD
jgi:hypothetical protein